MLRVLIPHSSLKDPSVQVVLCLYWILIPSSLSRTVLSEIKVYKFALSVYLNVYLSISMFNSEYSMAFGRLCTLACRVASRSWGTTTITRSISSTAELLKPAGLSGLTRCVVPRPEMIASEILMPGGLSSLTRGGVSHRPEMLGKPLLACFCDCIGVNP